MKDGLVVGCGAPQPPRRRTVLVSWPAVGEEYDAGHGVPAPAVDEHLGRRAEPFGDVGAPLGRSLPGARHPQEPGDTAPPGGDGHNAEAVLGPEVVDDEPHGLLQERELCPGHAAADVQHCHEVERRVAGRRFAIRHPASLDVHEDGEIVARRMYEPTLDS